MAIVIYDPELARMHERLEAIRKRNLEDLLAAFAARCIALARARSHNNNQLVASAADGDQ